MQTITEQVETPIRIGIKAVGIGKRGSKPLNRETAEAILGDLRAGKVRPAEQGAFFAGLFLKGLTEAEQILEKTFPVGTLSDPRRLAQALAFDTPDFIQETCARLLQGRELDEPTAYRLGQFLFSDKSGDGARGLVASALRVRYETSDEYAGLLKAMQETIVPSFQSKAPAGNPIIQLSEPFDGVDQSYMITPLLGTHLIKQGYRVLHMVGRNSGPKTGNNLADLAEILNASFIKSNEELDSSESRFGFFIHQRDLSPAIDRWVEIRRQTIKRPFLATLEKFLNPSRADIVVTSAFHPPYTEKMITIAERANFPGVIVIRNGLEGSLAFPLLRPVKITASARQPNGSYQRQEFEFDPQSHLRHTITLEEKVPNPSLQENARLIEEYLTQGQTGYQLWDHRIKASCAGLDMAMNWIQKNRP